MGTKRMVILMAAVAFLALFWVAGGVRAHLPAGEPIDQTGVTMASTMSLIMNYQGRLLDPASGDPKPDGTYTMTFRIYDVSTGGTALWSETKDVEVQSGLFNTVLGDVTPLPQDIFTGQDLWLGVKVGADPETSPRQQLLPMPYAIYAKNADTVDEMEGADLEESAEIDADISAHAAIADAHHARYTDAEAWAAVLANDGAGSGLDADLLDGQHGAYFRDASNINAGTLDNARFSAYSDLSAEGYLNNDASGDLLTRSQADGRYVNEGQASSITSAMIADGEVNRTDLADGAALAEILDDDGAGSGLDADLLDGQHASAFAAASHTHSALPIAYGFIRADGSVASGTPNVASIWDSTYDRYEITISGYSYFWTSYSTVVTPASTCGYANTVRTGSVGGNLLVYVYDSTGTGVQCDFQFVTFKP